MNTPAVRGLLATGITALALTYVKPPLFYLPDGTPRIASWATDKPDQKADAVTVPWWLAALAVGVAVDLFV